MDLLRIVPIKFFILISFYLRTNISAKYLKVDCYKDYEWVKKNIFFLTISINNEVNSILYVCITFHIFFRYFIQSGLKVDNYIFFPVSFGFWCLYYTTVKKMNEKVIFCFFTHVIHTKIPNRWTERKRTQIKN